MEYKPDKFTRIAVRVVWGFLIIIGLSALLFKGLYFTQQPGDVFLSKENIFRAIGYVFICLVGGVIWALYKTKKDSDPESKTRDDF